MGSEVLYDPSCVEDLAQCAATLLRRAGGGQLILAEPLRERAPGCRAALRERLQQLGAAEVGESPLPPASGDIELAPSASEPLVLLQAHARAHSEDAARTRPPCLVASSQPPPFPMATRRSTVSA